jgi:hypothetical protein
VGAGEAKNPEHVADHLAVGLRWRVHNLAETTGAGRVVQLQGPSTFISTAAQSPKGWTRPLATALATCGSNTWASQYARQQVGAGVDLPAAGV